MTGFLSAVLKRAQGQAGVRENRDADGHANNTGVIVETFQRSVGIPPGSPWCAAFVYWSINEEAKAAGIATPFIRCGYCPTIHQWAKDHGIAHGQPAVGDAFLRILDGWAVHIGLVTSVSGDTFGTIEGNSNAGGSSEGDGVYARTRTNNPGQYVFVRWGDLLPTEKPAAEVEVYHLFINGRLVGEMPVSGGHSMCPLRQWADFWGMGIKWDDEAQAVLIAGKAVPPPIMLIGGKSFAPITTLVAGTKLRMDVDVSKHSAILTGSLS